MIEVFVTCLSQSYCFGHGFYEVNFVTQALALIGQTSAEGHLWFNFLPQEAHDASM